ncbi:MAG TPA: hypothetical protein VKG22_08335 [Stellaceae bacterium]|nr:hypothetical protein [Stellaceae bacterium]
MKSQHLAGERQAARALVGGLDADDRVGDACDRVVLHGKRCFCATAVMAQ